jgi:hypothetical protein
MPVQKAAAEHGIPSGTLYGRCKKIGIELSKTSQVSNKAVFRLPGSASGFVSYKYGSGSFPFLIQALSGLK